MRYIKIEFPLGVLSATTAEYALEREGVKQARRETAVIALSNMHNKNTITNIMVENDGFERDEPTQDDIDFLINRG